MRRAIIITLVLLAIPLYTWNVYLLLRPMVSRSTRQVVMVPDTKALSASSYYALLEPVSFSKTGRSPFLAYKEKPSPPPAKKSAVPVVKTIKPVVPVMPPPVKITGIMWNPSNPIVMLKMTDGSSTAAREGEQAGAVKILKIEREQILVEFQGRKEWVKR